MLTTETLNRLEDAAHKQSGLEFGTTIAVMPGDLAELVRLARIGDEIQKNPGFIVSMPSGTVTKASDTGATV